MKSYLNPKNIKDIYPLSPMQEGIYFHSLLHEGSSAYFSQKSYRLQGKIDPVLVEQSLNEFVKRHDIMRTVFNHKKADKILQVVLKEWPVVFAFEDVRQIEDKDTYLKAYLEKDRQRSFDLTKDMLMRVALLRLGEREYEFVWSYHHILMDGWCMGIFIEEFFTIYNGLRQSGTFELPKARQFRSYIDWLVRQNPEASRNHWADYLQGYEEAAGVPKAAVQRAAGSQYDNQEVQLLLSKELSSALHAMAGKHRVTLSNVLQAVWGLLLGQYNDKRDVVFGIKEIVKIYLCFGSLGNS